MVQGFLGTYEWTQVSVRVLRVRIQGFGIDGFKFFAVKDIPLRPCGAVLSCKLPGRALENIMSFLDRADSGSFERPTGKRCRSA